MHYTLDAARRDKSPTENCCRILFMICWHKFRMIFNGRFIAFSVGRCCCGTARPTVLLSYREETKQPRRPIAGLPLLEFSQALESWSDIYGSYFLPYRSADVFLFCFFIRHLYICRSAPLFTERSLLHIMSRHAPYCWLATSLFWYSPPTQFSKAILKNYIPHL